MHVLCWNPADEVISQSLAQADRLFSDCILKGCRQFDGDEGAQEIHAINLSLHYFFQGLFKFEETHGLGKVNRCACFETGFDVAGYAFGGDDDHGEGVQGRSAAHITENFEAGDIRQHNVEEDQVWFFLYDDGYGGGAGEHFYHREAVDAHHFREHFSGLRFIFDDDY